MGIYTNGLVYGIRIAKLTDDEPAAKILFERKYNVIMSDEQKKESYLFYNELNTTNDIQFQYYTECSSTYDKGTFMMWYPISLDLFLEKIGV